MSMSDTPYRCEDCGKEFSSGQYLDYLHHKKWSHKK